MAFLTSLTGFWLYVFIFIGKVLELGVNTIRLLVVNRGNKLGGAILGIFEALIWVTITSAIITDITSDPMKIIVFCVGQSVGIYVGAAIEQRLTEGLTSVQVVLPAEEVDGMGALLRENGFGITIIEAHSISGKKRGMLFIQLKRKRVPEVIRLVRNEHDDALISVSDVRSITGGYFA